MAISPKYIILSGANRPPPRIWRGIKVSVITRAPAARSRAAAASPRSVQLDPPSNITGFAALLIARATASMAADGGGGALGGTRVGPLRVAGALAGLNLSEADRLAWTQRWIVDGFTALEPMIARHGRGFAFGQAPTLANCCLAPQVYSARRFDVDLTPFPALVAAADRANALPAFIAAHPDQQPDKPAAM